MKSERLRVERVAYGGDGVARSADGKVCFVPGVLPGELVEAEAFQERPRFRRARAVRILEAAAERIAPECPLFAAGVCPGCAYLHGTYAAELRWKQQQLHGFLVRRGLLEEAGLRPPFGAPRRFGLRNKLVMHCRDGVRGYVGFDNRSIVPVSRCPLAGAEINSLLAESPPEREREVFRYTVRDGALRVVPDTPMLTENLSGYGDFSVAPDGFFQTNIPVAAELARRVVEATAADGTGRLVELFCGVGVFSIAALEQNSGLTAFGVELSAAAVAAARCNAVAHGVAARSEFVAGDAGDAMRRLGDCREAVLLVDPPRTGLDAAAVKAILRASPRRIFYVSCAPDTLQRDIARLRETYAAEQAGLLDMFPGTAHFETLAVLRRNRD
ncbi:MAG: TRAM domain-containing protein [Lentisphaeria bacterium]|nr:TRAM domain-containing protein [Lentisphaeria bacterium]